MLGTSFFDFSVHLGAKRLDFVVPYRPAGSKIASKIAQVAPNILNSEDDVAHFLGKMELTCFLDPFRSSLGHHFGRFGMDSP